MNNLFGSVLLSLLFFLTISGFVISASAQVGTNNLFCPHVPFTEGMLNLNITSDSTDPPNFPAGMIGTIEHIDGKVSGGIDWMTTQGTTSSVATLAPTNEIGSQLITWWSLANSRNTKVQITNASDNSGPHTLDGLNVHVRIFGSDCTELQDFCDRFTALDTHVYDLADLTTNTGVDLDTSGLTGKEGVFVVTAVKDCNLGHLIGGQAIEHNFLSGNMYISDSLGYTYGTNMYARQAICNSPGCTGLLTGSSGATLDTVLPEDTYGLFNKAATSAGSDVVVMNLHDEYGPPYLTRMVASNYIVSIFDNDENAQSCGVIEACFLRLGIDSSFPARQDLGAPFTGP